MIRYLALLIAVGYPDANDCDALKSTLAFKMAVRWLPESSLDKSRHSIVDWNHNQTRRDLKPSS
jgi:hypothetical protein